VIIDTKMNTAVIGGELVTLKQLQDIVALLVAGDLPQWELDLLAPDLSKLVTKSTRVRSDADWNKSYTVSTYADGHMDCTCMDYQTRRKAQGTTCKHIDRVRWAR
jgi:hypothetical protein